MLLHLCRKEKLLLQHLSKPLSSSSSTAWSNSSLRFSVIPKVPRLPTDNSSILTLLLLCPYQFSKQGLAHTISWRKKCQLKVCSTLQCWSLWECPLWSNLQPKLSSLWMCSNNHSTYRLTIQEVETVLQKSKLFLMKLLYSFTSLISSTCALAFHLVSPNPSEKIFGPTTRSSLRSLCFSAST